MSVPYVLVYYMPATCNAESRMLYAGAKELMRNTAEVGKVIEIDSADDLEELPKRLSGEWLTSVDANERYDPFPQYHIYVHSFCEMVLIVKCSTRWRSQVVCSWTNLYAICVGRRNPIDATFPHIRYLRIRPWNQTQASERRNAQIHIAVDRVSYHRQLLSSAVVALPQ